MNKHGRIVRGGAIHLIDERGYPLCGSGQSSHFHNFRSSRARFHTTDALTCKKCLKLAKWRSDSDSIEVGIDRLIAKMK